MGTIETPFSKRVLQVCCAIIWCLLAAGPVFGFAALKPIMIKEGVYEDKCKVHNLKGKSLTTLMNSYAKNKGVDVFIHETTPCTEQDLSLNMMFTMAAVVTNVAALPVGYILDEYGPRVSGISGSILLFIASLVLKFARQIEHLIPWFDSYLAGYSFLALGGPFVFISSFQLANSFPKNSGLILALLTGAFDTSLALFLIYRLIYTKLFRLTLEKFFTIYMVVPIFILLCQLFIMPKDSYKTVATLVKIGETAIDETGKPLDRTLLLPDDRGETDQYIHQPSISEATSLLMRRASQNRRPSVVLRASYNSRVSVKSIYEQDAEQKLYQSSGGVFGIMHGFSISDQLTSSWFILMTLFTTIQMLRINYFVATIRSQELYLYHGSDDIATTINHFFDLALPLGGLCSIPFIGFLLDNFTTLKILVILCVISVFIGVMGLLSWLPATYAGIILLVLYRPFYYTSVSDFCAKVFGFDTFGTVYGMVICISGLCNLFQQILDKLTHEVFKMNPTPVNAILTFITLICGATLITFVKSKELDYKRRNLEFEAQNADIRDIPV